MLDLRKRIFIGVSVFLAILLALLLLYIFVFDKSESGLETETGVLDESAKNIPVDNGLDQAYMSGDGGINIIPSEPKFADVPEEYYIKQLAVMFVERFSSYSNQNSSSQIDDVLPLATDSMADWLETRRKENSTDYKGVNTTVVTNNITESTQSEATVEITARQQVDSSDGIKSFNISGRVVLQKIAGEWLVDALYWD